MSYTVSLRNSGKKAELKKQLDDGDIVYSFDVFKSKFTADDHDAIVDSWISSYGVDSLTRSQLAGLKKQTDGNSEKIFRGEIRNGWKVSVFVLKFSAKDKNGEREYQEGSANIDLSSDKEASRRLINSHYHDLAILAITGGNDSYTLSIE